MNRFLFLADLEIVGAASPVALNSGAVEHAVFLFDHLHVVDAQPSAVIVWDTLALLWPGKRWSVRISVFGLDHGLLAFREQVDEAEWQGHYAMNDWADCVRHGVEIHAAVDH